MLDKKDFRLSNGYEPTPDEVHQDFARTLAWLPERKERPAARLPLRVAVVVLALIALTLTGLAIGQWTVQWFYTERYEAPVSVQQLEEGAVEPTLVSDDLQGIYVETTSAVWMDGMLSVTLEFTGKLPGVMPLPREAMGVDGLRHDHVWWGEDRPEILPLADFAERYGEPLVLQPGELESGTEGIRLRGHGYDWLQQEGRIGYLLRIEVESDIPLAEGGEIVVRLPVAEGVAPGFGQEMEDRMVVFSAPYKEEEETE